MEFEKKAFFYWLDDGVVEIAVEMEAGNAGTWRTIDNDLSAKGKFSVHTAVVDRFILSAGSD